MALMQLRVNCDHNILHRAPWHMGAPSLLTRALRGGPPELNCPHMMEHSSSSHVGDLSSIFFFIGLKVDSSHNRVILSLVNAFHIIIYIVGTISLLISFTLQWKQANHTYKAYQRTIHTLIVTIKHHLYITWVQTTFFSIDSTY